MEEFKESKLILDLGIRPAKAKSGIIYRKHFGIYQCCYCNKYFEKVLSEFKVTKKAKGCPKCNKEMHGLLIQKHGMSSSRIYGVWEDMKARCNNKNDKGYVEYGGRGISVCKEWSENFMNFYEWAIANRYSDDLSIDRIDNDGNYEPDNCRWVEAYIQSANTRLIHKYNTSGYRGVSLHSIKKKWRARVNFKKKTYYAGEYTTKEEAAIAYDNIVIENNWPHPLNFPERREEYLKSLEDKGDT